MDVKGYYENLSTTKVGEHVPSDISVSTISSFKNTENKHVLWTLRQHMMKIFNLKKKKRSY